MSFASGPKKERKRRPNAAVRTRIALEPLEDRLAPADLLSAQAQLAYGQLPVRFEANVGQTDAQVQYLARGSGYALFLTGNGAVLSLTNTPATAADGTPASSTGVVLAMNLVGANPQAQVAGQDPLPGTTNYFLGDDPSQWRTGIANYGQVAYQDVYPGVNLVYYGNQQQLEYDFDVAPGADPGAIRFAVQGADSLSLDDQGNLILHSAAGDVEEQAPILYQTVAGVQQSVSGRFVLLGADEVGFQVDAYDASLPLTIDPTLSYSTFLGGSKDDEGLGIAVDSSGDAYVTGYASSANFPTTTGVLQRTHGSDNNLQDAFVAKLNPAGTALLYSTFLGGNGQETNEGIAIDAQGNAYVTGYTQSTDFPITAGAFQSTTGQFRQDVFVSKLDPTGSTLLYSTLIGGTGIDSPNGIAIDSAGDAFIAGNTSSTDLPTTPGAFQPHKIAPGNQLDAFVAKLNPTGSALLYCTYIGCGSQIQLTAMALDASGCVYLTGTTGAQDFPVTPGAFQTTGNGTGDFEAFATKLNATGTALVYSTYLMGPNSVDSGWGIAVDGAGDAYVTGSAFSLNIGLHSGDYPVTPGAYQTSSHGGGEVFVTELNPSGTSLIFSTLYGGSNNDTGSSIALDGSGDIYVTGGTFSSNLPITPGAVQPNFGGGSQDAFLLEFNATGSTLRYASYIGGSAIDWGTNIAVISPGNVYVTGYTQSTNFRTTGGSVQTSHGSGTTNQDAFVAKFNLASPTPIVTSLSPGSIVFGGSAGFTLTINGSSFDAGATVQWNGIPLVITQRTGTTQIQATVPASLQAAPGSANVTVVNPGPVVSATATFTINPFGSATTVALGSEFAGGSVIYDGSPHGATANWASNGNDGLGGSLSVTYVGIGVTKYGPTTTAPTNSGQYAASASFAGDVNHTRSSNVADFTINRVSATSTETFDVASVALQPSANLAFDNDFTRFTNAFADIRAGDTVVIHGTLDWSETHALASWAATGYAFAMPHVDNVAVEPASPGDGIAGPGDLLQDAGGADLSGEGPFYFDGLGSDRGWNITGLTISNFDTAFFYAPESDVQGYAGTHLVDNVINVPSDNADLGENGGILLGPGANQTIQGNKINLAGNGGASNRSFGILSFTSGGDDWNDLRIDNNAITVTTAGADEKILGIGENSGSVGSHIAVTNNTFDGTPGNDPANQQIAFGITSESVAATAVNPAATVTYAGNTVHGANEGFVWGDPEASPAYDFTGSQYLGIAFSGTTLTDVNVGFVARNGGKATIASTTIADSGMFLFGAAFHADGVGSVLTVADPTANYTGVQSLKNETNGGQVIFLSDGAGIADVSKAEGNVGVTMFSFPVVLDVALAANQIFTVQYATSSGTADGNDYTSMGPATLTFLPGQTSAAISVRVFGDFTPESDETFFVNLSNPTLITGGVAAPGHLSRTQATGTIVNDDTTTLSASISGVSHAEGNAGTTLFTFPATLNATPAAGQYFTVDYQTALAGSGAGFADGNDFQAAAGTLTFLAGSTTPTGPLTVAVFGDTKVEPNETFNVALSNPQLRFTTAPQTIPGNLGASTAAGTIVNDDTNAGIVSINSVSKAEGTPVSGNSSTLFTTFTFTISLTGTITSTIKVNYQTAVAGSGSGYADGNDFQGTSGQATFTPSGTTTASATVTVYADKAVEPNEIFDVLLTIPAGQTGYTLGTSLGVGTIVNDD
jgi:hypothetical protein